MCCDSSWHICLGNPCTYGLRDVALGLCFPTASPNPHPNIEIWPKNSCGQMFMLRLQCGGFGTQKPFSKQGRPGLLCFRSKTATDGCIFEAKQPRMVAFSLQNGPRSLHFRSKAAPDGNISEAKQAGLLHFRTKTALDCYIFEANSPGLLCIWNNSSSSSSSKSSKASLGPVAIWNSENSRASLETVATWNSTQLLCSTAQQLGRKNAK